MKILSFFRSIGRWLTTPISDDSLTCNEILPTAEYHIWVRAGSPQEPTVDLTWDSKRDDNPQYDSKLAHARARLRELLVEEMERKKKMKEAQDFASEQARKLKRALSLGPGMKQV